MKKIVFLGLFVLATLQGFSQTKAYQAEKEGWLVKMDEAYKLSKETGKPILANFTGSDWCGWCRRLTASVFSKPAFKKWADENVILLELDYPKRKTLPEDIRNQNASLQQAFKIRGFPTIWVFNLDQDEKGQFNIEGLGQTGYRKSVKEFTDDVDRMLARGK